MRKDVRARVMSATIVIAISILAILTVSYLPNFGFPSFSNSNGLFSGPPLPSPRNGTLTIEIEVNVSTAASVSRINESTTLHVGLRDYPLRGVTVEITNVQNSSSSLVAKSNSIGKIITSLRPSAYIVKFLDWRFNYTALTVNVNPGGETTLHSLLNATSYAVQAYDISDSSSLGWMVSWEPTYLYSPQDIQLMTSSFNYLGYTSLSPEAILTNVNSSGLVKIQVSSAFSSEIGEWLTVLVQSPVSITTLESLQILTLLPKYVVIVSQ